MIRYIVFTVILALALGSEYYKPPPKKEKEHGYEIKKHYVTYKDEPHGYQEDPYNKDDKYKYVKVKKYDYVRKYDDRHGYDDDYKYKPDKYDQDRYYPTYKPDYHSSDPHSSGYKPSKREYYSKKEKKVYHKGHEYRHEYYEKPRKDKYDHAPRYHDDHYEKPDGYGKKEKKVVYEKHYYRKHKSSDSHDKYEPYHEDSYYKSSYKPDKYHDDDYSIKPQPHYNGNKQGQLRGYEAAYARKKYYESAPYG